MARNPAIPTFAEQAAIACVSLGFALSAAACSGGGDADTGVLDTYAPDATDAALDTGFPDVPHDSPAIDAAMDAGNPGPCDLLRARFDAGAILYCESFEDWPPSGSGAGSSGGVVGMTERVSDPVQSVPYALHSHIEPLPGTTTVPSGSYDYGVSPTLASALPDHLFVRYWWRLNQPASPTTGLSMLSFGSSGGDALRFTFVGNGQVGAALFQYPAPPHASGGYVTGVPVPAVSTWTCHEMEVTLAATGSQFQLWVNDTAIGSTQLIGNATSHVPFDRIRFGIVQADQAPLDVFIDDVVVSTTRIGCGG